MLFFKEESQDSIFSFLSLFSLAEFVMLEYLFVIMKWNSDKLKVDVSGYFIINWPRDQQIFHGIFEVSRDFLEFLRILKDFKIFRNIWRDLSGLLWNLNEFQNIILDSNEFYGM